MTNLPWEGAPETPSPLRVLFVSRLTEAFYCADAATAAEVGQTIHDVFGGLPSRFGITVLGTLDDDRLAVGGSETSPWTGYILADVPELGTVIAICNLLRETWIGEDRLWKFMTIEARVGRPRYFERMATGAG